MSCSNCGKNRDSQRFPYRIHYMTEHCPFDKLRQLQTSCQKCLLKLGYARKFTIEEQKLWRNEDQIWMEKLNRPH